MLKDSDHACVAVAIHDESICGHAIHLNGWGYVSSWLLQVQLVHNLLKVFCNLRLLLFLLVSHED